MKLGIALVAVALCAGCATQPAETQQAETLAHLQAENNRLQTQILEKLLILEEQNKVSQQFQTERNRLEKALLEKMYLDASRYGPGIPVN